MTKEQPERYDEQHKQYGEGVSAIDPQRVEKQ
jgi:hypothetical protein